MKVDNNVFQLMNMFQYLGTILTNQNNMEKGINKPDYTQEMHATSLSLIIVFNAFTKS